MKQAKSLSVGDFIKMNGFYYEITKHGPTRFGETVIGLNILRQNSGNLKPEDSILFTYDQLNLYVNSVNVEETVVQFHYSIDETATFLDLNSYDSYDIDLSITDPLFLTIDVPYSVYLIINETGEIIDLLHRI